MWAQVQRPVPDQIGPHIWGNMLMPTGGAFFYNPAQSTLAGFRKSCHAEIEAVTNSLVTSFESC